MSSPEHPSIEKEFVVPTTLTKEQQAALLYVREKAIPSSAEAKLKLLAKSGWTEEQLDKILKWIKDDMALIIHVDFRDHLRMRILRDTDYRNQFETRISNGRNCLDSRTRWEHNLFGTHYDSAIPYDRVKYGAPNLYGDIRGVGNASPKYGNAYFILKSHIRNRVTFSASDSGGGECKLGTLDHCCHILALLESPLLHCIAKAAERCEEHGPDITKHNYCISDDLWKEFQYSEIQIHGPVVLKEDIEALVVPFRWKDTPEVLPAIKQWSAETGVRIVWF